MKMLMLYRLPVCSQSQRPIWLMIFLFLLCVAPNGLADNPATSCSNTTVNSATNDCYTVSPLPGTVTIDGLLTGAEWAGAPSRDLTGDFLARIRFKRSGNNLHFLISVDDAVFNASDRVELYFDPLHNHATTEDDIIFRIKRGNTDHRRISSSGDSPWAPGANLDIEDQSTGGAPPDFPTGWAAEVTITDVDLATSDLPAIMGFAVLINDQNTSNQTSWPDPFPASAATWVNLKTRYPIEYMIALDVSGSMLYMLNNTLKAIEVWAYTSAILNDPKYFEDKVGLTVFLWTDVVPRWGVPLYFTLKFSSPSSASLGRFIISQCPQTSDSLLNWRMLVSSDEWLFQTPIGHGLDGTFAALGTGVEEKERWVLLLSDGLHNRPHTQVPLQPGYLDYDPCPTISAWGICPPETDYQIRVNTIALGQDSQVDAELMTNIKNRFAGSMWLADDPATEPEELQEYLISSLEELYQMNLTYSGSSGSEFTVNSAERKLIVILSWSNPTDATDFNLQQKASASSSWSPVPCDVFAKENVCVGSAVCVVNNPAAGIWRVVGGDGNPLTTASRQFVILDPNLRAKFAMDRRVHGTGQDIILTANLQEAGIPVSNDPVNHPVEVKVNIKRPDKGWGTYISVRTSGNCKPQPPELPFKEKDMGILQKALTFGSLADSAAIQPTKSDVKPRRFAKFDSLYKVCPKDILTSVQEPKLELYDDGTHGDSVPNDGTYTLQFTNTKYDGSYVVRFEANGISPSGSPFHRIKTIAEYVRVEVDPAATSSGSREYQHSGNIAVREFYVIPRDHFNNYLGPGHPDVVQFMSTAGSFVTPVIDYNNGIYSQLISYNERKDRPVITPVVQGKLLAPIRVFQAVELVLPFCGYSYFNDALNLKNGTITGARWNYWLTNQLSFEIEGGATFTENTVGKSGRVIQALANLRYPVNKRPLMTYVTIGAGYLFFRNFGVDDQAFAYHAGIGFNLKLIRFLSFRVDGRVFHINDVMGVKKTTNIQTTGGLVFRF